VAVVPLVCMMMAVVVVPVMVDASVAPRAAAAVAAADSWADCSVDSAHSNLPVHSTYLAVGCFPSLVDNVVVAAQLVDIVPLVAVVVVAGTFPAVASVDMADNRDHFSDCYVDSVHHHTADGPMSIQLLHWPNSVVDRTSMLVDNREQELAPVPLLSLGVVSASD
jgi:hypothetical protein